MKKILLLFTALLTLAASAQSPPDEEELLKAIIDSGSRFYYPSLMDRYRKGDTSLDLEDYRHLYYGYALQEEYNPSRAIPEEGYTLMIFETSHDLSAQDCTMILEYAEKVMDVDPFSPRNMNFMTYAYGALGNEAMEIACADRLMKILATIDSSGTGLKPAEPWHIIFFSHANDFLGARGLYIEKRTIVSKNIEYAQLIEKDGRTKGYYFDYGRIYRNYPEKSVDDAPRGLRFKNLDNTYRIR